MQFTSLLLAASSFALASAVVELTNAAYNVTAGQPFTFTWTSAGGPVTLTLKDGSPGALNTVSTIASGLGGDSYTWSVPSNIASDNYAIGIDDGLKPNFSPQFKIAGASGTASSASSASSAASSSAASTSAAATTASAASSSSASSSASASNSPANSTTASSSSSTAASSTKSSSKTASPSSTSTSSVPNTNTAAQYASPLALVFLTIAALITLN